MSDGRALTGQVISKPEEPTSRTLGLRLREIREQNGLTLRETSLRTGIPVSTLSKVQNHQLSLNYENLVRLSAGLKMDIGEFFRDHPADLKITRRAINLRHEGVMGASERYIYEILATELSNKRLVPGILTITATSLGEIGGLSQHKGEEFIYVLEGEIDLYTEFYTPVRLGAGDSAYIDSTMGHAYVLVGEKAPAARVLAVCSHDAIAG